MICLDEIKQLCLAGESNILDYKEDQYLFENNPPEGAKGELLKDILAFANSNRQQTAYILIGVEELPDKTGRIVGIPKDRFLDDAHVQQFVNSKINRSLSFRVYPIAASAGKFVQVIEIDTRREERPFYSRKDIGVVQRGKVYIRVGSSTNEATPEQIKEMGLQEAEGKARPVVELPRGVSVVDDWSAAIVEDATVDDLDPEAVDKARIGFASAHADKYSIEEVVGWSVGTLLGEARLARNGKLTRAALLLLGKRSAAIKLSPHPAQITWGLEGSSLSYEHFSPPFLLATSDVYRRIRNVQIKILPDGALLPVNEAKYKDTTILEALHNCIAHQDYRLSERIVVMEYPDHVELSNAGSFFEGKPEDYIDGKKRPVGYRNRVLADAMADLNMIDTYGKGIHTMFEDQRARFLPMPDIRTESNHVSIKIYGKVVDEAYSKTLIARTDLSLADVALLDRVQKRFPIDRAAVKHLRKLKLIEGHLPSIRVSRKIAQIAGSKAEYVQLRATEDLNLKRMIRDYLRQWKCASRSDLDVLLLDKLHRSLTERMKYTKIGNLLSSMRKDGIIRNVGSKTRPQWVLVNEEN